MLCLVRERGGRSGCKKESGDRSRTEDEENGVLSGKEAEKVSRVERHESADEEVPREEVVSEFSVFFAEIALQLVSRGRRKEVQNTLRLVSDVNFGANGLRRHMMEAENCKRISEDGNKKELARKNFKKETVKVGNGLSISGAVL